MQLPSAKRSGIVLLVILLLVAAPFVLRRGQQATETPAETTAADCNATMPGGQLPPELRADGGPDGADGADGQPEVVQGVVSSGDTAAKILQEWLSSVDVHTMVTACEKVYSLARLRAGQPYTVVANASVGGIERFEYEIDNSQKLIVSKTDDSFAAKVEPITYDVDVVRVEGVIESNLFQSVADAGESPTLAIRLADIFGWEVDFIRDIREGDSFTVLVEKRFREGEFKGYGRVLAAIFTNQDQTHRAYLFHDDLGFPQYYNPQGASMRRSFLKAPLSFTRISSGYTMTRKHPIFRDVRPHQGVDYAAPTGTPVKAVGNGVVSSAGWGNGYGNLIILRHANGYESYYGHLSGFARGVRKGATVKQGDVIGYVGATGWATGPHLDFRLKKDGKFINPTKNISPRAEPVARKLLPDFRRQMDAIRPYLDGDGDLATLDVQKLPNI
jgi:murein DD-endopeptidase MepM/ murein hydrolase activator NlpD